MLKHVFCTSQDFACNRPAWSNWALISITDSGAENEKINFGRNHTLLLSFDDIDYEDGEYLLFDEIHARSILELVEQCSNENVEGIHVHCRKGLNRSAAIAKWIGQKYGLSFSVDYEYNKHVYSVLREV